MTSIATVGRAVGDTEGCYHTSPGTLYLRKRAELPMTLVESWGRSVQHDDSHDRRFSSLDSPRRVAARRGRGRRRGRRAVRRARFRARRARVDLGDAQSDVRADADWPVPPIVTRAQWGANEALRKPGQTYDSSVLKLIVHHTGTPNDVTDYAGLCRGILANETSGEYIDIAYNWLIDPNGRIYEGRWAQNYPAGAPHTGERNGANVRGAHAIYNNANTIGIALMGTYDTIDPPPAMVNALVTLLAWKCARWGIDPIGRGTYLASNGVVENLFNICGHRDTSATDCPGQRVEPMLPAIRAQVASRITGAGYWIATEPRPGARVRRRARSRARRASGSRAAIAGHRRPPERHGLLAVRGRRRRLRVRRRRLPRVDARPRASPRRSSGMASTPSGNGLLAGRRRRRHLQLRRRDASSARPAAMRLNAPVLGMTPTQTGQRLLAVRAATAASSASATRVFHGSTGNIRLNQPVVSMAARPQGDGYWMIARDGGVFSFGKAPFVGSGASCRRRRAVRRRCSRRRRARAT